MSDLPSASSWPPPRDCVWEITLACNLRCRHCGSSAGLARPQELDTAEALSVVDALAELGCSRVTLMGGEVFVRTDWPVLVAALRGRGVVVEIISNGWSLDAATARRLVELGVRSVTISIDGPRDVHDALRGLGSFERAVAAVQALDAAGLGVGVSTQVHRRNLAMLPQLYAELLTLPVSGWQLQLCQPLGRAQTELLLAPEQLPELEAFIIQVAEEGRLWTYAADNIGYMSRAEPLIRSGRSTAERFWNGCGAGVSVLGITSDGQVRGCMSLPETFAEGSLRERSLLEIWNDPTAFAYNRQAEHRPLAGACVACAFARLCRGGCSSLGVATTGRPGSVAHCLHQLERAKGTSMLEAERALSSAKPTEP